MAGRALVTGASGTIGSQLLVKLIANGWETFASSRRTAGDGPTNKIIDQPIEWFHAQTLTDDAGHIVPDAFVPPRSAFVGVDTVFHLSGIAHQTGNSTESMYQRANVVASAAIARQAIDSGVAQLIFVSSIAAAGHKTNDHPLTPASRPQPHSAYGRSKWDAERQLTNLTASSPTQLTIVRPPLVYGPNPKGNLIALIRLIHSGIPLPWAAIDNRRSMIGVSNLVDLLADVTTSKQACGRTLMPCDANWSTPELVQRIAGAMGVPARLFMVPDVLLHMASHLPIVGKRSQPLLGSLIQQDDFLNSTIGWKPAMPPVAQITAMVRSIYPC